MGFGVEGWSGLRVSSISTLSGYHWQGGGGGVNICTIDQILPSLLGGSGDQGVS